MDDAQLLSLLRKEKDFPLEKTSPSDMAPWRDPKLFFCILFITFCCSMTLAVMPIDCCLSVKNKQIGKGRIVDFRVQAKGCSVAAIILVTKRGINLCVPPNEEWVRKVMTHVEELKKHCRENDYKRRRCSGLNRA